MDIRASVRRWASYRQTVKNLSSLNNRQLKDIGITRGEIKFVARDRSSLL